MTISQKNQFEKLAKELGYDVQYLKERAMEKYQVADFSSISSEQMDVLLGILEKEKKAVSRVEVPKGDFPNYIRIWDTMMREWLEEGTIDELSSAVVDNPTRFHVMQWTGREDDSGRKIFDFDYITSAGKRYLVQWDWEFCCWTAYDDDNLPISLGSFGEVTIAGNVYSGVRPL